MIFLELKINPNQTNNYCRHFAKALLGLNFNLANHPRRQLVGLGWVKF